MIYKVQFAWHVLNIYKVELMKAITVSTVIKKAEEEDALDSLL